MCLFPLETLIKELLVIQIVTWFAAQCIGVVLIRRLRKDIARPFQMPLYPLPVMIALLGWFFIFGTSGWPYIVSSLALVLFGVVAFRVFTRE
jgi:hypothetical protein